MVPATLELGGKSANIVFPDANMKKAVKYSALAILMNQGQACESGSRLFLHKDIHDEFLKAYNTQYRSKNFFSGYTHLVCCVDDDSRTNKESVIITFTSNTLTTG